MAESSSTRFFRDTLVWIIWSRSAVTPGAPLALDLGPQLAPGSPRWRAGSWLGWGPWHLERTQLPVGDLACIPRKFATATPHRRVIGPRWGPIETRVCIDRTIAPQKLHPCTLQCRVWIFSSMQSLHSFAPASFKKKIGKISWWGQTHRKILPIFD